MGAVPQNRICWQLGWLLLSPQVWILLLHSQLSPCPSETGENLCAVAPGSESVVLSVRLQGVSCAAQNVRLVSGLHCWPPQLSSSGLFACEDKKFKLGLSYSHQVQEKLDYILYIYI